MSGGPQVFLGATTFCSRCRQISGRRPVSGCRQISGRREACPPARRPRCELRSARRLEARPGPAGLAAASNRAALGMTRPGLATAHGHRSRASQAPRRPPIRRPSYSAMSHVIHLRVFQTLKSHRWNCNVLRGSRKLTLGNYVRLLCGFGFVLGLVVGVGQALERFFTATSMHAPITAAMTVGRIQPSWFAWSGLHMSTALMCSG